MISGVGALVVLVALTSGCPPRHEHRYDDYVDYGTAETLQLSSPGFSQPRHEHRYGDYVDHDTANTSMQPNAFRFSLQKAIAFNSFDHLDYQLIDRSREAGQSCRGGDLIMVPAGGSVTITSLIPWTVMPSAPFYLYSWVFTTVPGSTFDLTCSIFDLRWRDALYVYEYRNGIPLLHRKFRRQEPPPRMELKSMTVQVQVLYDRRAKHSHFSCVITASGGSTTPSNIAPISSCNSCIGCSSSPPSNGTSITNSTTTVATASKSCKCGLVNRRLMVSGANIQVNEYPWHVGLMNITDGGVFCGGSLISDRHIVTAAHCVVGLTTTPFLLLLSGHSQNRSSATEEIARPIRITTHPQYQFGFLYNDISIIEIAPLNFDDPGLVVRPICLPNTAEDYAGVLATVIGEDHLSQGGVQHNILQEVDVRVITNTHCQSAIGVTIANNMICAGNITWAAGACWRDHGGSLIAPDSDNYELIGVTSFGHRCGSHGVPAVFARVTAFQSWIESTVAGSPSCSR